jgi:hypothetical protein
LRARATDCRAGSFPVGIDANDSSRKVTPYIGIVREIVIDAAFSYDLHVLEAPQIGAETPTPDTLGTEVEHTAFGERF